MPFDSTKPINGTLIDADELRAQFNALKELNDALQAQISAQQAQINSLTAEVAGRPSNSDVLQMIAANAANSVNGIGTLDITISDPPTHDEVWQTWDKLNELINDLQTGV